MKKDESKHDSLFIILFLLVLFLIVGFSWVLPISYYDAGKLTMPADGFTRIGIFDITNSGVLGLYLFPIVFVYIFAVGAFYKILGSTKVYKQLITNIADKLKGKEKIVIGVSTLVFGILSNIISDQLVLLVLIPFIISILSKLKVNKISALVATFGGTLLGVLSNAFGGNIVGTLANSSTGIGVAYGYELLAHIIIFVIGYVLLLFFTFRTMNDESAVVEDLFIEEEKNDTKKVKVKTLGISIILILLFVISVLAFIKWEDAFNFTFFNEIHESLINATIGDSTLFYYLLGSTGDTPAFQAFGSWNLAGLIALLIVSTFLIMVLYNIPFKKIVDEISDGAKKMGKVVAVIFACYAIVAISISFPTIAKLFSDIFDKFGFNVFTQLFSSIIGTIFVPDFYYNNVLVGSVYGTASNINTAALAYQFGYGIASFVAPTSIVLALGLSMLNIKIKEYFKFIWKFIVAILIVAIAILMII